MFKAIGKALVWQPDHTDYYQKDNSHRYATLILKDKSHLDVPICGLNKLEITVKIIEKIKEVYY